MRSSACRGQRILFIAPLPPPISGHSLASETLLRALRGKYDIDVVDLAIASGNDGSITLRRILEVVKVIFLTGRAAANADAVYLTISESVAGNLKDLVLYLACRSRLPRMVIHLHGGSLERDVFQRNSWLRAINGYFLRKISGVIVTGPSHRRMFADFVRPERIHDVANFASDDLFVSEEDVNAKYLCVEPLRVLYLSTMSSGKGYRTLLAAFQRLSPEIQSRIRLDFAGRFNSIGECDQFLSDIAPLKQVQYHGVVTGESKAALLRDAHVLCLPTALTEGQPICMLEGYAAGCTVLATMPPGVSDVFAEGVNGFLIDQPSTESVGTALLTVLNHAGELRKVGLNNWRTANHEYREHKFCTTIEHLLSRPHALPNDD